MNFFAKTSLALAMAASLFSPVQAAVVNGGFDRNLNGWSTLGDAYVQNGQLRLTTTTSAADDVDANGNFIPTLNRSGQNAVDYYTLATATGLPAEAFDPSIFDFAYEGALVWQDFSGNAGDTLSFLWSFGTRDTFPDYAFFIIDGLLVPLASTADALLTGSGDDLFTTGSSLYNFTLSSSGNHRIAFGVVDVNDVAVMSSLTIDQVRLSANELPEPGTLALLGLGLGMMVWQRRRQG